LRASSIREQRSGGISAGAHLLVDKHYDRAMADEKRAGFVAGGPRRTRSDGAGFWAFLRDWITTLFGVDRRM
jgi:hypothetical protein